jgi:hypothetical protein
VRLAKEISGSGARPVSEFTGGRAGAESVAAELLANADPWLNVPLPTIVRRRRFEPRGRVGVRASRQRDDAAHANARAVDGLRHVRIRCWRKHRETRPAARGDEGDGQNKRILRHGNPSPIRLSTGEVDD